MFCAYLVKIAKFEYHVAIQFLVLDDLLPMELLSKAYKGSTPSFSLGFPCITDDF